MLRILIVCSLLAAGAWGQGAPPLSAEAKAAFLLNASVKEKHPAKKGVTGTMRVTMTDGKITHDASVQTIDEFKNRFETPNGVEMNFQDSYKLNIAAYRLGKMLGMDSMTPVSVERMYEGKVASYTWWVEDIQMDEVDRMKKKIEAPDKDRWSRQYLIMKVFDQLIYNMDRNAQNMMYDKEWGMWLIDHSRSFRRYAKLLDPKILTKCDRVLLEKLKSLQEDDVRKQMGRWVDNMQIKGLMARRKLLVDHFEAKGEAALYDFLPKL